MTMSRTIKLYKLEPKPQTPGFREMRAADVPRVTALLNTYDARRRALCAAWPSRRCVASEPNRALK